MLVAHSVRLLHERRQPVVQHTLVQLHHHRGECDGAVAGGLRVLTLAFVSENHERVQPGIRHVLLMPHRRQQHVQRASHDVAAMLQHQDADAVRPRGLAGLRRRQCGTHLVQRHIRN